MTKDEIKALIAAKIAGQGTNVDAGSVLPTILNGIIDLLPDAPAPTPQDIFDSLTVRTQKTFDDLAGTSLRGTSKTQVCSILGISTSDLDNMMAGKIFRFIMADGSVPVGGLIDTSIESSTGFGDNYNGPIAGSIQHHKVEDVWDIDINEV